MDFPASRYWIDWSARHFSELAHQNRIDRLIAVLPIGAVEQHGPHLPVGVDTHLLNGAIEATIPHLSPELLALFLPTQALGKSNEHLLFPGTLSLSMETLRRIWFDLGESLARTGIRKLVFLNSHGGQSALMETVARDLRVAFDLIVVTTSWAAMPLGNDVRTLFTPDELRFGIHAGDMETSMMLARFGETVSMAHSQDFVSVWQERAQTYPLLGNGAAKVAWQAQDLNSWGAAGDATKATPEKGQAVFDRVGLKLAELLNEVDQLPLSTLRQKTGWMP